MNHSPDTSGIRQMWAPGRDARVELAKASGLPRAVVDRALAGLWNVVSSRRRSVFVGIGAFEWRPWKRPLPTGRKVRTWRLAFKPSRYAERWHG